MSSEMNAITVRYWAAARSAAGTDADELPVDGPITLSEAVRRAVELHPGSRLADVLGICSVLVGERPVGKQDPDRVEIPPGSTVEFLPPFAGG